MFLYALIGLVLVLVGIAGLQFTYLFYVDRLYRERQKYILTVENPLLWASARYASTTALMSFGLNECRSNESVISIWTGSGKGFSSASDTVYSLYLVFVWYWPMSSGGVTR